MSHFAEDFNWDVSQQNLHLFPERDEAEGETTAHWIFFAATLEDGCAKERRAAQPECRAVEDCGCSEWHRTPQWRELTKKGSL